MPEHGDRARAPALHQPAHERHEHAVEEEAQRHDQGVGGAVGSEIRDDGLQERADREAHAGRQEHHDGEGDGDPPSVEHALPRHGRGHYSRAVDPGQSRAGSRGARKTLRARALASAGTAGAPSRRSDSANPPRTRSCRSVRGERYGPQTRKSTPARPSARGVNAARISRGARRTAAGGTSSVNCMGELAGPEQDLALAEDPDVTRDEADHGSPEHVAGQHEVDGALLEPEIAQEGQIQRGGDGAEHREVVEPAVADLRVALPGGPLGGAGEARPRLEPAAQAPAAERGQEALRAGVAEVDRDGVAGRPRQADGGLAAQRALRELAAERLEGEIAAAEPERGGELADLYPLRDPERRDRRAVPGRPARRRRVRATSSPRCRSPRPAALSARARPRACRGVSARRGTTTSRAGGTGSGGGVSAPPAEPRRRAEPGVRDTRRSKLHSPCSFRARVTVGSVETHLRDLEPASEERQEPRAHDQGLGPQHLAGKPRGIADDDLPEGGAREERDVQLADGHGGAQSLLGGGDRRPPERLGIEVAGEHEEGDAQQGDGPDENDGQDLESAHVRVSREVSARGGTSHDSPTRASQIGRNRRRPWSGDRRGSPRTARRGRRRRYVRPAPQARRCGSRRSRSPSPRRFAPRTTREIATPGTVASHHAFDR